MKKLGRKSYKKILPYKTAFIGRHIVFIQTQEFCTELSFQSLLEFTGSHPYPIRRYYNPKCKLKLRLLSTATFEA